MYKLPYLFPLLYFLCKEKRQNPGRTECNGIHFTMLMIEETGFLIRGGKKSIHGAQQMGAKPNSSTLEEK